MPLIIDDLITAVDQLNLTGRPVMVHTSLRSFGQPLEDGPDTLLDALLSRDCTILVPSFTEPQFGVIPPPSMRPPRNGVDYTLLRRHTTAEDRAYTVDCGLINTGMGAVPTRLITRTGARRGRHPLNSFAALGPQASELIDPQDPTDVYAPIRALMDLRGSVLLIGVGLNRMTALHLAEQHSGRRLYIRWAQRPGGEVAMVETGSCSEGFPRLNPYLSDHAQTTFVGTARWSSYLAQDAVHAAATAMAADQTITQCPDHHCILCRDSIAGGPIGPAPLS